MNMTDADSDVSAVSARTIFALAFPALGVLAATPLYLLIDTAVVGHLGGLYLAGLAAATTIQAQVTTQLTFLSYGTTARAARHYGAGDTDKAVSEGVQATWLALIVGAVLAAIVWLGAPTLTSWLAHSPEVANLATRWLRVAGIGVPLILATMAGNGWMRGIQNTRTPFYFTLAGVVPSAALVPLLVHRYGLVGSAVANLVGESITALLFLWALVKAHQGGYAPHFNIMRKQLVLGRDLIMRSLSFQVAFVSAASVAARFGASSLAAHQILLQLWSFLSLVLDALAIAAQSLVGSALGAGAISVARSVGTKVVAYSAGFAAALACVFAVGFKAIPGLFTNDHSVMDAIAAPWWILVGMIVVGGIVFALDGVLLGAADAAFLRTATLVSVIGGFLPGVWLALIMDTQLTGVWCGLAVFLLIRLAFVVSRFQSMKWARGSA